MTSSELGAVADQHLIADRVIADRKRRIHPGEPGEGAEGEPEESDERNHSPEHVSCQRQFGRRADAARPARVRSASPARSPCGQMYSTLPGSSLRKVARHPSMTSRQAMRRHYL